jgi:hypothetical protein
MSAQHSPSLTDKRERLSAGQVARIAAARLYAFLGWPGCAGGLIGLLSALVLFWLHQESLQARQRHQAAVQSGEAAQVAGADNPSRMPLRVSPPALPHGFDAMAMLKRIETAVRASGLTWPQAEYRQAPIGDEGLATLEIRTTLKGPYPKLRQLITTLLDKEPALALRELNLTRANGDTPDVEAKVRWVVFLADGWAPAETGGRR